MFCLGKSDDLRFFGCVLRISCRSMMVVCIPLVLRVRAVITGWEYGCVGGGVLDCVGFCCVGGSG